MIRASALAAMIALAAAASAAPAPKPAVAPKPAPDLPPPAAFARPRAPLPAGFRETVVAESLASPTAFALAPDGRAFVCEQGGTVRVVRNGRLLPRPFLSLAPAAERELGLLGIALDPAFARTGQVYLCYTAAEPARHNRVVRVTASGDTAIRTSLRTIFELDPLDHVVHVGGALRFLKDGTLLVGTGDNDGPLRSQSLSSTHGKLLRITRDGAIPRGNPFAARASGRARAIWALGFRNAFTFDVHPRSGRVFVNDVGGSEFEEVDEARAGKNYGWPAFEGPSSDPRFVPPLHAYRHDRGCAITGGAFYAPPRSDFPRAWFDRYLFADFCASEIRWIDPRAPKDSHVFLTTRVPGPVDLRVASDGALWYLARGDRDAAGRPGVRTGALVRVSAGGGGGGRGKR